jgi:hypothetical protein
MGEIVPSQLPVGTTVAGSTIKTIVRSGARVRCMTPFATMKPWRRLQFDCPVLEVDKESSLDDIKELIFFVVFMPVILSLQHAQPHDRVVHLT